MIRMLSPEERRVLHRSLNKLQQACMAGPASGTD